MLGAALVVSLSAGLLLPDEAAASCGDWLAHSRPQDEETVAEHRADRTPVPPAPCHGPKCSRQDDAPVAPAPKITVELERWACLMDGLGHDTLVPAAVMGTLLVGLTEIRPLGVFRPPR